jgi:8-oxo-dGTP diphosphatase
VILVRDGRVLLGRRAVEPSKGLWDIPGGFLNPWELPDEAAARELLEETSLTAGNLELLSIVQDTYGDQHYVLNFFYLCETDDAEPQPDDDVDELRWFAPADIPQELAFKNCRIALDLWLARGARVRPASLPRGS